jgi:hypothetical protein
MLSLLCCNSVLAGFCFSMGRAKAASSISFWQLRFLRSLSARPFTWFSQNIVNNKIVPRRRIWVISNAAAKIADLAAILHWTPIALYR